jgi:hypothetical protein
MFFLASGEKNSINIRHNGDLLVVSSSEPPTGVLNFHKVSTIDPIIKIFRPFTISITRTVITSISYQIKISSKNYWRTGVLSYPYNFINELLFMFFISSAIDGYKVPNKFILYFLFFRESIT